jgi:hypothetical protein
MITVTDDGNFKTTTDWLKRIQNINPETTLGSTGQRTVDSLRTGTPKDTGITAGSWSYRISKVGRGTELAFLNNSFGGQSYNIIQGIRFGHGTGTGGYVPPNDFVSPIVNALLDSYIRGFVRDVIK